LGFADYLLSLGRPQLAIFLRLEISSAAYNLTVAVSSTLATLLLRLKLAVGSLEHLILGKLE
jgi:hypothetical protein